MRMLKYLFFFAAVSCSDSSQSLNRNQSGNTDQLEERSAQAETKENADVPIAVAGGFHLFECQYSDFNEEVGCLIKDQDSGEKVDLKKHYEDDMVLSVNTDVSTEVSKENINGLYHWKVKYDNPNPSSLVSSSFDLTVTPLGGITQSVTTRYPIKINISHELILAASGEFCTDTCSESQGRYKTSSAKYDNTLNNSENLCSAALKKLDSKFSISRLENIKMSLSESAGINGGCSLSVGSPTRYFYDSSKVDPNYSQGNIRRVCVCTK